MENCIEEIKKLELLFSDNQYSGAGKEAFVIKLRRKPTGLPVG